MASRTVDGLLKKVESVVKKALKQRIIPYAIIREIESIEEHVYGVYEPALYERRYSEGGLISPRNFKVRNVGDGMKYELENITPGKNNRNINIAELVYGGDGYRGLKYDYPAESRRGDGHYTYLRPRDFITPAVEHIRADAEDYMRSSLDKNGVRVKG